MFYKEIQWLKSWRSFSEWKCPFRFYRTFHHYCSPCDNTCINYSEANVGSLSGFEKCRFADSLVGILLCPSEIPWICRWPDKPFVCRMTCHTSFHGLVKLLRSKIREGPSTFMRCWTLGTICSCCYELSGFVCGYFHSCLKPLVELPLTEALATASNWVWVCSVLFNLVHAMSPMVYLGYQDGIVVIHNVTWAGYGSSVSS